MSNQSAPLTSREQHSLNALKHTLATILINDLKIHFVESIVRAAILEYGQEHIDEIEQDVLGQITRLNTAADLFKGIYTTIQDICQEHKLPEAHQ